MSLPKFVSDDPTEITQELIAAYEAMTGKTVYPAQVDRVFIDLVAYSRTLTMSAINDVGRQNLVAFARAPIIDYLGELVGVIRLPAQGARATVRIADAQRIFKEREIENDALVGSDFLDDDEAEKIDDVGELL